MEYLFSYGTLQRDEIQSALFRRKPNGWPDTLLGFVLSEEKAYGSYPVLIPAEDSSARVSGMVYEVDAEELKRVDAYEGEAYRRISAPLASGKKAWVYVQKSP